MAMPRTNDDPRETAKRLIRAIIDRNGGSMASRTLLYKAFYAAHVYYWKREGKYLTTHQIVHMPQGPGIDDGRVIIDEMIKCGDLSVRTRPAGPYEEDVFQLLVGGPADLTPAETKAIDDALEWIRHETASSASQKTHADSRCWQITSDGQSMHYPLDCLSEGEFDEYQRRAKELAAMFQG